MRGAEAGAGVLKCKVFQCMRLQKHAAAAAHTRIWRIAP